MQMVLSGIWKKQDGQKDPLPASITVRHDKDIPAYDIQDLCASVGWSRRDPALISKALANSLAVVSVWDDGILVALARATGDKVFREVVVYTPPNRDAVCLEPYTCVTDAINLQSRGIDAGWRVLEPGAEFRTWIDITARPVIA